MLVIELLTFGFAWWLGLYLLARDPRKPLLRWSGLGLLAYALALGFDALARAAAGDAAAAIFRRLHWLLIFTPALFWCGALIQLAPEDAALRARLDRGYRLGFLPLAALLIVSAAALEPDPAAPGPIYLALAAFVLLPLLGGLVLTARRGLVLRPRRAVALLVVAGLFFGLSTALLLAPLAPGQRGWILLGLGIDLLLLDVAIAMLDAFDEGETLLPDITRAFVGAGALAVLFGGLVALAMALGAEATPPMLALLLATVAAAVAVQTLADPLQGLLDRLAFAGAPGLRAARAELRESASALPRLNEQLDPLALDDDAFARLTRRALSHFGDLPRLAASPLTRLPLIDARLAARGAPDQPLERAGELKQLLEESIARLKPRGTPFGTTDAWRYYNALYFPYVVGLRPYSRRSAQNGLDPLAKQALDWFSETVPERTLHNWQNAAAKLVAQDIRAAHGEPKDRSSRQGEARS